jgi:hypothetical protein
MLEDVQKQAAGTRQTSLVIPAVLIAVIILIVGLVGVAVVLRARLSTAPPGGEASLGFDGGQRAIDGTPRRFVLWELHSDDTVRVVEWIRQPDAAVGSTNALCGPLLWRSEDVLSVEWMGGTMVSSSTSQEAYGGSMYVGTCYLVETSNVYYGYDMRISGAPHLHIQGDERLISVGIDPKTYAQEIIAVAIPVDALIKSIFDYQPYRHVVKGNWDILYYDTTAISGHVSIHISYVPGADAPRLDSSNVESSR